MRTMRTIASLSAVAATLALAGSARAETNSRPDGTQHPFVGMFVGDFNPAHPGLEPGCVGTLISPTVFITAGHCIFNRPERQAVPMFVTFDPEWSFPGTPTDLHPVAAYHWDPTYVDRFFPSKHDRAILVLAHPVEDIAPAQLPTAGQLDALAAQGGLNGALFESVGYGTQGLSRGGGPPQPIGSPFETGLIQRRVTVSRFSALTPSLLHLLTEDALGLGGNCAADSGSPHLLPGTTVVAATSSWIDNMCEALSANPRTDTPEARAFLGQYVDLP